MWMNFSFPLILSYCSSLLLSLSTIVNPTKYDIVQIVIMNVVGFEGRFIKLKEELTKCNIPNSKVTEQAVALYCIPDIPKDIEFQKT